MLSIRGLKHKSKGKVFTWKQTLFKREAGFTFPSWTFRISRRKPAGLLMLGGRAALRNGTAMGRAWSG